MLKFFFFPPFFNLKGLYKYNKLINFLSKRRMLNNNQEFYISKLIIKSVLGTLSSKEAIDFEEWYKLPTNKAFYSKILKEENLESKKNLFKNIDKETAYLRLVERIEKKQQITKRNPLFSLKKMYKYAAVAILLISVGYYGFSTFYTESSREEPNSTVTDLKPGYDKATLVLEDGTEVVLEKNEFVKKQSLAEVKNEANALIYKSDKNNDPSKLSGNVGTNTLLVPIGGIYKLVLPDGTRVWINSSSSLKYPVSFAGDQRIVELVGEAYFEVMKDANKDFIVKTKTRNISVLGTSFNVSAYNDDAFFAATLAEGKIKLVQENQKDVFLKPGDRAVVEIKSLNTTQITKVDPQIYTAWKNGTFFFENESLENILRKVGRWYNFKTDFSDAQLRKITFTGLASKEYSAKRLLDRISKSSNIKYEIIQNPTNEENLIKISKKAQ